MAVTKLMWNDPRDRALVEAIRQSGDPLTAEELATELQNHAAFSDLAGGVVTSAKVRNRVAHLTKAGVMGLALARKEPARYTPDIDALNEVG